MFFSWLGRVLDNVIDGIVNAITWLGSFLSSIFSGFFNAIKTFLTYVFKPILDLIYSIFYLFAQLLDILIYILKIIWAFFVLIGNFTVGIFNTLSNFANYSGSTVQVKTGVMGEGFDLILNNLSGMGLNIFPYVLTVFVFFLTALAVIRIAGGRVD